MTVYTRGAWLEKRCPLFGQHSSTPQAQPAGKHEEAGRDSITIATFLLKALGESWIQVAALNYQPMVYKSASVDVRLSVFENPCFPGGSGDKITAWKRHSSRPIHRSATEPRHLQIKIKLKRRQAQDLMRRQDQDLSGPSMRVRGAPSRPVTSHHTRTSHSQR